MNEKFRMKEGGEDKMETRVLEALGNHYAQSVLLPSNSDQLTQSLQSLL